MKRPMAHRPEERGWNRFLYRCLLVVLAVGVLIAWTAVPEPELIAAGMR